MRKNGLKKKSKPKIVFLFLTVAITAGFLSACNSASGEADDIAVAATTDNHIWNLLAITDPAYLETADRLGTIDWGEWTRVTAFYPNQVSYQWLSGGNGPAGYHEGANDAHLMGSGTISNTVSCVSCHYEGGFDQPWTTGVDIGMHSGHKKDKTLEIRVRAAFDDNHVYLHARWKSDTDASGRGLPDSAAPVMTHQTYRYDGKGFGSQAVGRTAGPSDIEADHVDQLEPGSRFNYEDRLAVMIVPAAKNVEDSLGASFNAHGCFMTCHADLRNMPEDLEKVQGYNFEDDPVLGSGAMDVSDLRHYILRSRDTNEDSDPRETYGTRFPEAGSSFDQYISEVVAPDIEKGNFIDLWQARTGRSVPMGQASADYIHAYRLHNNQHIDAKEGWAQSGRQNWFNNRPDPDYNNHMAWIYDARKTGYWAIHENDLARKMRAGHGPLITKGKDNNALNLQEDDLFEWDNDQGDFRLTRDVTRNGETIAAKGSLLGDDLLREGNLVPRRALQKASGARSAVKAFSNWDDGVYEVVFVRERKVSINGEKTTDHAFEPDSGQTLAFSIFDDHASNRGHYVTFPLGLISESAGKSKYHSKPDVNANALVILAKSNEK